MYPATEFERMPYLDSKEFAEMLRSNHSDIDAATDTSTVRHRREANDTAAIPKWIDAVRNAAVTSRPAARPSSRRNWKSAAALRGLLLTSVNSSASPDSANFSQSPPPPDYAVSMGWQTAFSDVSEPVSSTQSMLVEPSEVASTVAIFAPDDEPPATLQERPMRARENGRTQQKPSLKDRQTASVRDLLSRNRIGSADTPAADHATLINNVVAFLRDDPDNLERVAQRLCRVAHAYGGQRNEKLTSHRQHTIVDNWLATQWFGETPEACVLRQLLPASPRPMRPFVDELRRRVLDRMTEATPYPSSLDGPSQQYLQEQVLAKTVPALMWEPADADTFGRMEAGTVQWGFIQAGLRFAADLGLDTSKWETKDAQSLGEALGALLHEGAAPRAWAGYFAFPAWMYAVRNGVTPPDSSLMPDDAAQAKAFEMFRAAALREYERHDPFTRFAKEMGSYKTRPQLALSILNEKCPTFKNPQEHVTSYLHSTERYCVSRPPQYSRFNHAKPQMVALPDPSDAFAEQNRRIAASAADLDNIMLPIAFATLGDAEAAFIAGADVHCVRVQFSAAHTIRHTMAATNPLEKLALMKHFPADIEFFSARRDGQERIYALCRGAETDASPDNARPSRPSSGSFGYRVYRVDRNADLYRSIYLTRTGQDVEKDHDYRLEVFASGDALKQAIDDARVLYGNIRQIHQENLERALHAHGFEQTTLEKVKGFLWNLVPFYSCVTGIANRQSGAVISCVLDVVSLVPLAGQAGAMVGRFGQAVSRGALASLRQAAARTSVRHAIRHTGKNVLRQAAAAGMDTLTPKAFAALAVTTLKTIDPGVQLLTCVGHAALRRAGMLFYRMRDIYPVVRQIPKKLARRANALRGMRTGTGKARKARLPESAHQVDVAKIGRRRANRRMRDIYVRIDPHTGDRFGRRYYLDGSGTLTVVPRSFRRRMQAIREQGMSGRGAIPSGKEMARANRPHRRQNVGLPPSADRQVAPRARGGLANGEAAGAGGHRAAVRIRENPSSVRKMMDLPQEDLDAIAEYADAGSLAALYDVNQRMRSTVESVLRRKWPLERRRQETLRAALADETRTVRLFAAQGLKIDDVAIDGRSLLAVSLGYKLSRDTYTALLDMTTVLNGNIIKGAFPVIPNYDQPLLDAAIRYRNRPAVEAVVNCARYDIPPQGPHAPGYVAIAAQFNDVHTVRYLVESGRFSVNDQGGGFTALHYQLSDYYNDDLRVIRYLLSRVDIDLDDPYLINSFLPKNPRRFALVIDDPRVDINAPRVYDAIYNGWHTPLTASIYSACAMGDDSNFNVLIQSSRVDVNKAILCKDNRWLTPEQYVRVYHLYRAKGLGNQIINRLRDHPSYRN